MKSNFLGTEKCSRRDRRWLWVVSPRSMSVPWIMRTEPFSMSTGISQVQQLLPWLPRWMQDFLFVYRQVLVSSRTQRSRSRGGVPSTLPRDQGVILGARWLILMPMSGACDVTIGSRRGQTTPVATRHPACWPWNTRLSPHEWLVTWQDPWDIRPMADWLESTDLLLVSVLCVTEWTGGCKCLEGSSLLWLMDRGMAGQVNERTKCRTKFRSHSHIFFIGSEHTQAVSTCIYIHAPTRSLQYLTLLLKLRVVHQQVDSTDWIKDCF